MKKANLLTISIVVNDDVWCTYTDVLHVCNSNGFLYIYLLTGVVTYPIDDIDGFYIHSIDND